MLPRTISLIPPFCSGARNLDGQVSFSFKTRRKKCHVLFMRTAVRLDCPERFAILPRNLTIFFMQETHTRSQGLTRSVLMRNCKIRKLLPRARIDVVLIQRTVQNSYPPTPSPKLRIMHITVWRFRWSGIRQVAKQKKKFFFSSAIKF